MENSQTEKPELDAENGLSEEDKAKLLERRKKVAAASRLSRARKREEIEHLKAENKRLKSEQGSLHSKMEMLEKKVEENLGEANASYEDLQENEKLKKEIEAHKKMMNFFLKVWGGYPTEKVARQKLYTEGADNAHAYLLSLISQSQTEWEEAKFKEDVIDPSVKIHYKISDKFFGESETSGKRFNLRFDCTLPAPAGIVAECIRCMFSEVKQMCRIWQISEEDKIELTNVEDEEAPEGVSMLRQRKNKDVLFLVNKKKCFMPKTSLAFPEKSSSKNKTKHGEDGLTSQFGDVEAWSVTTTSSTVRALVPEDKLQDKNRISSVIILGAIIWEECHDGMMLTRVTFINSNPQDWVLFDYFAKLETILTDEGVMTDKFSVWIMQVFRKFQTVMMETMTKGLKLPNFGGIPSGIQT